MADIFDELNEDLRAERARALARRYGGLGAGLLVLVLAGVGAWQGWVWWQDRQNAAAALQFTDAMQLADTAQPGTPGQLAAADAFAKVAATAPAGYRALAQLREASLRWDGGQQAVALSLWNAVSADSGIDTLTRDLGSLLWAQHQVDGSDPGAVLSRVRPLEAAGNPWRPLAQETEALLALRANDRATATKLFRTLAADPAATEGVRGRAGAVLTMLGDTETNG